MVKSWRRRRRKKKDKEHTKKTNNRFNHFYNNRGNCQKSALCVCQNGKIFKGSEIELSPSMANMCNLSLIVVLTLKSSFQSAAARFSNTPFS